MEKETQISTVAFSGSATKPSYEVDLVELFYALLRSWKWILLSVVLGTLAAGLYTTQFVTPIYEATSKLYVVTSKDSVINLSDFQIGAFLTSDYQDLFKNWEIHEQVNQNLSLNYSYSKLQSMLHVTNPANTRILYITVKSPSADEAAFLANEYAEVARKYISDTMRTDEPSITTVALKPLYPASPSLRNNLIKGFLLGALLSFAVVFIRLMLDDRLKTADDISMYAGLPTLAIVPVQKQQPAAMGNNHYFTKGMKVEFTNFGNLDYAGGEAINTLCTNLSFMGQDKKIIMFTSCQESEGKTFLSLNMARTMTQLGKRVVLIDADLRRSVMNARFGIHLPLDAKGLAHYLAGMCQKEEIIYETKYPNAWFIPVGHLVTNSLALINKPILGQLLQTLILHLLLV